MVYVGTKNISSFKYTSESEKAAHKVECDHGICTHIQNIARTFMLWTELYIPKIYMLKS